MGAGAEPVLLIARDGPDGWLLIGRTRVRPDRAVVHLSHALDADPTLLDVLDLAPGCGAMRRGVGEPWLRTS